jgi:hypothetical protein
MRRNNLVKNVTIGFVFAAITLTGVGTAASALTGSRAVASVCDPLADPVYQGNANKGGGEGNGETKATPDADYTKSLLNPETVTPATPAATETVVSVDQRKMNYGSINNAVDSLGVGNEIVSK